MKTMSAAHVASVTNLHNHHEQDLVLDLVHDPVSADPHPVEVCA